MVISMTLAGAKADVLVQLIPPGGMVIWLNVFRHSFLVENLYIV